MSWDNYEPLSTNQVIHFDDELDMIMGDGIAVPDEATPAEDYTGTTHYHIAGIDMDACEATLWNYTDEHFETVSFDTIYDWRKNDAPFTPILLNLELTASPPKRSIVETVKSAFASQPEHIGIKIHGSLMQSPLTIKKTSRDEFGFTMQMAIREGVYGNEITEPWNADISVTEPDYDDFIKNVKETLGNALVEQTSLDSDAAEEFIVIALKSYEANLHKRVGLDETTMFEDFDELTKAFDAGVEERADGEFAMTFHERANNNLIHHF